MPAYDPADLIKCVKQMSDTEKAQLLSAMELSHPLLPAHADPEQTAAFGLHYLEKAVLEVLTLETLSETPTALRPSDISRRIGIPATTQASLGYAIVHGVLDGLAREGRVEKEGIRWRLKVFEN